ncbi:RNA-splicing factor [Rhypophila decipiens]
MGSGDLNMKKSWHPQRSGNLAATAKAEAEAIAERKKMQQRLHEIEEERKKEEIQKALEAAGGKRKLDRVEWMYTGGPNDMNGDSAENEAYLLGKRRIDKLLQDNEVKKLSKQASIEQDPQAKTIADARDIATKIREDPLLAIKRKEQQAYEAMMNDPIKRRRLLASMGIEDPHEKSKPKEEKRHKHRHHHRSRRHDDDDRNSRRRSHDSRERSRTPRRHDSDEEDRRRRRRDSPDRRRHRSRSRSVDERNSRSRRDDDRRSRQHDRRPRDLSRSRSPDYRTKSEHSRDPDRQAKRERSRDSNPRVQRDRSRDSDRRIKREDSRDRQERPPRRDEQDRRDYQDSCRNENRSGDRNGGSYRPRRDNVDDNRSRQKDAPVKVRVEEDEERARKLAAMQEAATDLDADRRRRLADIEEAERKAQEEDDRARQRNKKFGGNAGFTNSLHSRAVEMKVSERMGRAR